METLVANIIDPFDLAIEIWLVVMDGFPATEEEKKHLRKLGQAALVAYEYADKKRTEKNGTHA